MKVFVTSKIGFDKTMKDKGITNDNVESYKKTFFVSINDTNDSTQKPYFGNKTNVKVLFFDDTEKDLETTSDKKRSVKAFTEEQTTELLEFIESNKDKETCIVHCAAGISRSGAVGTFITEYFNSDFDWFKKTNPQIHPNRWVLDLLKKKLKNEI
jgi:predicted protein tyrosine phosphatase